MTTPSESIETKRLITVRSRLPTARIFLRSPLVSDAHSLTERAHDPECTAFLPHISHPKNPITIESNERQVRNWQDDSLNGKGWFLVVALLPEVKNTIAPYEGDPSKDAWASIGDTGLVPWNLAEKTGETGIMLNSGPLLRGQGYAVETLDLVFALGFDHLKLETVELQTDKDNVPMQSLMEKRFGVEAVWREKQGDWSYTVGPEWWKKRQETKGEARVVIDVEDLAER